MIPCQTMSCFSTPLMGKPEVVPTLLESCSQLARIHCKPGSISYTSFSGTSVGDAKELPLFVITGLRGSPYKTCGVALVALPSGIEKTIFCAMYHTRLHADGGLGRIAVGWVEQMVGI